MTGSLSSDPVTKSAAQDPVSQRVEALERENKRLRQLGVYMLIGIGVLLGLTSAIMIVAARHGMPGMVAEVAEARKYLLRDGDGRVRGIWGMKQDGAAQMTLADATGQDRIRFSVLPDGSAGVAFVDSANNSRMVLGVLPDQSATVVFADQGGKTRTVLGLMPNGSSTLVFADRGGVTKAGIGIDTRGLGTLTVVERPGGQVGDVEPLGDSMPVDSTPAASER